jgi:HEPN domain-containing protein
VNLKREKKFQKNYAHELLRISQADIISAKLLAGHAEGRVENVFLLAQQSIEKGLKAVICWLELPVPFTHDIAVLVERLRSAVEVPFEGMLDDLSEFASIRRYMEGHESFTIEEVNEVLQNVLDALAWCNDMVADH